MSLLQRIARQRPVDRTRNVGTRDRLVVMLLSAEKGGGDTFYSIRIVPRLIMA
jgi:hypothetical protein